MVTTASTKMRVRPASRTFSASSLGVFWRAAPSTSAIMRSRKLEPSSAVIRTLMRSDRTWVPPVTAERSPPASRMTGADSPVIADSSMVATPSMISPSPGTMSPASTSTTSPILSALARTGSKMSLTPTRTLAIVSLRMRRSVSAWALPRPSATASAKVANSSVTQSQATIWISKPMPGAPHDDVADHQHGGDQRHQLDGEHHRVLHQLPRVELGEARHQGGLQDGRVEQRLRLVMFAHDGAS